MGQFFCEAAQKIIRLEQYKDRNSITCNCGIISGGVAENTVPEKCVFTADFRFNNEDERKEVEKIANEISAHGIIPSGDVIQTLRATPEFNYPQEPA